MTCKFDCGRLVDVGFFEADSCREIRTDNVYNIILMSKGSLTLRINGNRVKGDAPCIWVLKENLDVEYISSQKLSAQSIHFDVAFLYRSVTFEKINSRKYKKSIQRGLNLVPLNAFYDYPDTFSYVLPLSEAECVHANSFLANFYCAVHNQSYERWSCQARTNLNGLLELIHQVYLGFINPNKQSFDIKNTQAWVQAILKKIHLNYSNASAPLSLVPLAKEIGINKDTVSKKFNEIVGCSVGDYILDYRIMCACRSLGNTKIKVKDIASACGFASESYFNRQFQNRKDMSPEQYRKSAPKLRQAEFSSDDE
ncbi:MAG: AraC family transcriptional regulator [Oscillospiraceae bacterium]|nr:AraC family transcriptional regulator [Oscillospiraceae bacterium]MDD4414710.1 AraC family transcriptional regulator [Oscillospiraceae bacterium]